MNNPTNQSLNPTAVDLFSGCGGLTVGLKMAGFRVLGAVDIDPLSMKTYEANHTDVTIWEADIKNLEPAEVSSKLGVAKGDLDLLTGCPPCQGFSTMRTLNGAFTVDDPRNDLLFEFLRFVEELNPRVVMMENVPGLAQDGRFAAFCDRMKSIGLFRQPPCFRRRGIWGAATQKKIDLHCWFSFFNSIRGRCWETPNCSGRYRWSA